jgi:capsular exopolysaccharide synthesis family protein
VKPELPSPKSKRSEKQLVLDHSPVSLMAEIYRSLRSSLLLSQAGGPPQTMLMTSAARGEGKTTTLVNTAIVFAQMDLRVLIIDADLRRPRCHTLLNADNGGGLVELLAGQIDLQRAIKATRAEHLFFMSAGAAPPNPAELLASRKMHEVLQQLREQYEFIFIDSSPVMAVTDAVILSTIVDGTLLVINGKTSKQLVRQTQSRLTTPHTKILGTLLNQIDIRTGKYGGYYNQYFNYYPSDEPSPPGTAANDQNGNGEYFQSPPEVELRERRDGTTSCLEVLVAKLTLAMGPMAKLVVHDRILALGESEKSFPRSRLEELTREVSQEISNESLRVRFEEEISAEIQKVRADSQ